MGNQKGEDYEILMDISGNKKQQQSVLPQEGEKTRTVTATVVSAQGAGNKANLTKAGSSKPMRGKATVYRKTDPAPSEGEEKAGWTKVGKGSGQGKGAPTQDYNRDPLRGSAVEAGKSGTIPQAKTRKCVSGAAKRKKRMLRKQVALECGPQEGPQKRIREVSDESQNAGDVKRVKVQGSYREALIGVKMAVIADDFPDKLIGEEELGAIQDVIWDELEGTPDPLPQFELNGVVGGALHITCDGEGSANWLRKLSGKTAGSAKIRVVDAKELPKPIKMAWKSKNIRCVDLPRVLKMLQRLNPALRTSEWKVVDTRVEGTHVRRIVLMDTVSADVIKAKEYRLYSGIERSVFKLLDGGEKKEDAPAVPEVKEQDAGKEKKEETTAPPGRRGEDGRELGISQLGVTPLSSPRTEDILEGLDDLELSSQPSPAARMEQGSEAGTQ